MVVVVVGRYAEYAFAGAEHIVVNSGVVVVVTFGDTAVVHYLHRVHAFVFYILPVIFKRPRRVVVGYEISGVARVLYHQIYVFGCVPTDEVGFCFVKFHFVFVFRRAAEQIRASVPVRLRHIVLFYCDITKVARSEIVRIRRFRFKTVQSEEFIVRQLVVSDEYIVIRIGDDRIAVRLIYFF